MNILWLPVLVAAIAGPTQGAANDHKLLLVQILFRHGNRAPVQLYPTDPNPATTWTEGLGKLSLLGKEQHYALGKLFRQMYGNFITSSPNEVTVNSSNSDRCVRSALSTIASFYSPSPEWKFDNGVPWQPIPVYSVAEVEDEYLSAASPCQRANKASIESLEKITEQIAMDHKEMIRSLSLHSGLPLDNFLAIFLLQDTLEIEKQRGLIIPQWAEDYWDELKSVTDSAFYWFTQPEIVQRLRIGPLLGKIVGDMTKKSAGEIPNIKVRLYSSHDFEIATMLEALKVYDKKRPPYSSSLVFELYENVFGGKVVRFLYFNSTTPENIAQEPHILILNGCSEYCPLDFWVKYTKHVIPDNWEEECKIEGSNAGDTAFIFNLNNNN